MLAGHLRDGAHAEISSSERPDDHVLFFGWARGGIGRSLAPLGNGDILFIVARPGLERFRAVVSRGGGGKGVLMR